MSELQSFISTKKEKATKNSQRFKLPISTVRNIVRKWKKKKNGTVEVKARSGRLRDWEKTFSCPRRSCKVLTDRAPKLLHRAFFLFKKKKIYIFWNCKSVSLNCFCNLMLKCEEDDLEVRLVSVHQDINFQRLFDQGCGQMQWLFSHHQGSAFTFLQRAHCTFRLAIWHASIFMSKCSWNGSMQRPEHRRVTRTSSQRYLHYPTLNQTFFIQSGVRCEGI